MEILLNPNVAYISLVASFLFIILALLAPGTGLLEVAALFTLLPAGYAMYNLPVNWWALALLVLAFIPFFYAIRRPGKNLFVGASILLAVIGSAFLFREENWQPAVHPLLATMVSLLLTGFLWISARKTLDAFQRKPAHNLQDLIGALGETRTPVYLEGSVYVRGELWSARSNLPLAPDTPIRVTQRDGFILEVEPTLPTPVENHP